MTEFAPPTIGLTLAQGKLPRKPLYGLTTSLSPADDFVIPIRYRLSVTQPAVNASLTGSIRPVACRERGGDDLLLLSGDTEEQYLRPQVDIRVRNGEASRRRPLIEIRDTVIQKILAVARASGTPPSKGGLAQGFVLQAVAANKTTPNTPGAACLPSPKTCGVCFGPIPVAMT